MGFELARELRDADFPNNFCGNLDDSHCDGSCFPFLSKLIAACGLEFGSLYQGGELGWIADKGIHEMEQEGATPEEAVAKLWLALNKK